MELDDLWPVGARLDQSGELWLGGCAASTLAEGLDTPLYVFDEATLHDRASAYREALLRHYPGVARTAYAAKAYLCLEIARIFAEEGLDLDVVSGGELFVALRAGFPAGRINFHGNNKSRAELAQAIDSGVGRIVVDNFAELKTLIELAGSRGVSRLPVWLRLSPGIQAHTHTHIQTGHLDSKFGFPIETGDAEAAVVLAMASAVLELVGLHAHIGSQIYDAGALAAAAGRIAGFAAEMGRHLGFQLQELSPGGGWGVRMTDADPAAPIELYVAAVAGAVTGACRSAGLKLPRLILEPGRSLIAQAGVALYRVGARKEISGVRTFVSVDGGIADNIRPALYGASYTAIGLRSSGNSTSPPTGAAPQKDPERIQPLERVTISGKFCESGDVLIRDIDLPRLEPGDLLAVPMAGAYTLSMASNYNMAPRPAAVLVGGGSARVIQRRERYADLVARDLTTGRRSGAFFRKYQALGNDYIVLDPVDWPEPPDEREIQRICDRHRGVGADGILWGPTARCQPFGLRLFNPDGSECETSGNGLRIFARYLWETGLSGAPAFAIASPAGVVVAHVLDQEGGSIAIEMGRLSFDSDAIPVSGPPREVIGEELIVDGRRVIINAATIGNPHCVVFLEEIAAGSWPDEARRAAHELGPHLERHPMFASRTNVQFARAVDRHTVQIEIWERGAGYTLASGTSSCAAAGIAIKTGRCESPVTVSMPGGSMLVEVDASWAVRLTGPVTTVCTGEILENS